MKLKVVSQSMKKIDRNGAHIFLELNSLEYVLKTYLPSVYIRRLRGQCRDRAFLVKQRTAVKNCIRDPANRLALTPGISTKKRIKISGLPALFSMHSSMIWNP